MKRMTLKAARCLAALSQRELAEAAGLGSWTVYAIERRGQRPRWYTIRALSAALGVEPKDIAWPGNPLGVIDDTDEDTKESAA